MPNWSNNLYCLSSTEEDAMNLYQWNHMTITSTVPDLDSLRPILGQITTRLNEISLIFKQGVRGYNPEMSQEAAMALDDIQNIDRIHQESQVALNSISQDPSPQSQMLQNMLYSILQMNFNESQKSDLMQMSGGTYPSPNMIEEVNTGNLQEFLERALERAIYSVSDPSERTLKVIREVLQNAGDAALAVKRMNPEYVPSVEVYTQSYIEWADDASGEGYMDLMVRDNGIGMDWATLSQKFYIYFMSGKDAAESTGGFGIAKAIIQETPDHGWSIDTNGIHSSRFGKNVYMSGQPYEPQQSQRPDSTGTSLTLFKIPNAGEYEIIDLCKKFASEELKIFMNGNEVEPLFKLSDLTPVSSDGSSIVGAVANTDVEQQIASDVIRLNSDITDKLGDLQYPNTVINFYVKPTKYSGNVHVTLNGQHQFKGDWIQNADIIVSIRTTSRPGTDEYPMDPGRDNLRGNYKEDVKEVVGSLKELLKKISDSELFKEGLDLVVYNKDMQPLKSHQDYETDDPNEAARKQVLKNIIETQMQGNMVPSIFPEEEKEEEDAESIIRQVQQNAKTQNIDISRKQSAMLNAAALALQREKAPNRKVYKEIERIIDGLSSPLVVSIQRNFVSREIAHEDPTLTANLSLLWLSTVKRVVDHCDYMLPSYDQKAYSPGFIYSDKAIALFQPAKNDIPYNVISINPVVVASVTHPSAFEKYLSGHRDSGAFKEAYDQSKSTPIKRVAQLLFHSAVHEVTHLFFPDHYGGHENFHNNATRLEQACHDIYDDVRNDVKRYMPGLKDEGMKLIRATRDGQKDQQQEVFSGANWLIKIAGSK